MSENDVKILYSELGELKGMVNMGFTSVRERISLLENRITEIKAETNAEINYLKSKAKGYDRIKGQILAVWVLIPVLCTIFGYLLMYRS